MDDLELFPRQAVIVKNGKIFVEDEPFFCAGSSNSDDNAADNDDDDGDDADDDHLKNGGYRARADDKSYEEKREKSGDVDVSCHDRRAPMVAVVDSNRKGEFSASCFDDVDSEKENRVCRDLIVPETHADDLVTCGQRLTRQVEEDEDDDDEEEEEEEDDEDEDERFMKLVDREEFYEDVDGLRLQGLPDGPVDPTDYLDFMHSGQEVQRISVITALPSLLKENNAECMRRVVPKVREVLYVAQQDMQLAASSAFLQILQEQLIPVQNYTQTFLQTILSSVDSKDSEVAAAWLDTLLDVIDLLPKEIIKKDILAIAISKGQLSQPLQARLSCCKILGKVATKFEPFMIKKEILPVVQQLCQDVEHEVRACMCYQLDSVARGLGLETTKNVILPELLELADDEESDVRIVGLDTVVNILSLLDDETRIKVVIPLVHKFCQRALTSHDPTLPVVAKQLGKLCHGLQSDLSEELKSFFLEYYKKLCRMGCTKNSEKVMMLGGEEDPHVQTRQNAAYNFPAMVTFAGVRYFKAELHTTLTSLCKDSHVLVRQTIASGFHEVAKFLGTSVSTIFPELIILLKDERIEVLQGVVSGFPSSLEVLSKTTTPLSDLKVSSMMEVVNTLLSTESVVFASNNWRLQEDMMNNMACLGKVCSSEMLYTRVVPVLLQKMKHGRALPVRHAAARSLLVLMRCVRKLEQRKALIECLTSDFCQGHSCHSRSLFLVICKYVIELYSKAFFKDHLFLYVLPLAFDPVPNIRLRTCALLPDLKRLITLPYDNTLKTSLEACVRKVLVNEKDKDVLFTMKKAVDELDQIPFQMESLVSRRKNFEDDAEDQAKEEEEKRLLEREDKEKKEDETKSAKFEKRNSMPVKKDFLGSRIPAPKKGLGSTKSSTIPGLPKPDLKGPDIRRMTVPTTSTGSAECNGQAEGQDSLLLSHMIKSKSTTSIPSLSHIPRPASRPSTPPRKEASCRIPVLHSLGRPDPSGSRAKIKPNNVGNAGGLASNKPIRKISKS